MLTGEANLSDVKRKAEKSRVLNSAQQLSCSAAEAIIHKAVAVGRVDLRSHLSARMTERTFDSLDVERVLRCGVVNKPPEHDIKHGNWKYCISTMVEGCTLEVVVVIDGGEDYEQPLIQVVTGYWTGRSTSNGKRTDVKEKPNKREAGKKVR
jgi:hypothetical protein